MTKKLKLSVVSQDRQLLDLEVDSVTAPAQEGELTILPGHVPLFTPLLTGEIIYRLDKQDHSLIVSKGFLDMGANNHLTIIVDTAKAERDLSAARAQEAIEQAKSVILTSSDQKELQMAEASLRLALLELRIAQRTKKTTL